MSGIVGRLEEAGLVTRAVDPTDRRAVRVRATERGRQTLERGRRLRLDQLERRLRDLSPEELAVLGNAADLMERLARA
ncbi:MAG: winged helix DNA-binding protein [Chloroflexi bacterium]|nr:winged helix DNA-binding protein [Chloroflexota bacterium]